MLTLHHFLNQCWLIVNWKWKNERNQVKSGSVNNLYLRKYAMKISSKKMSNILFEVWLDNFLYYFFDKVAYFSLHTFSPRLWIQTPDSLCIALFICNRDMKYNVAKNIGKFFSVHATAFFFCVHLGVFLGLQCWQCQCSACEIPSVSVVEGGGRQAEMSPSGDGRGLHRHGAQEGGMGGGELGGVKYWSPSQYKDGLSRYGDFHYKDKTVLRPSYLYDGNPYTGKTIYLYWDSPL